MRALQLLGWKQPPQLVEVPEPRPGPGQVSIRVAGAGACHSDLHLMHDFDAGQLPWGPPFTLGHENTGWVDQVGDGVTGLEIGEPVAVYGPWGCGWCRRCRTGMENYCERQGDIGAAGGGLGCDGGMADHMLVPNARHLVPLDDLDPVLAAPLTDAGLTPYHAIKRSLPLLGAGATAVVIGAGGLGHLAVQILAALSPATIIVVDSRDTARREAAAVGASYTLDSTPATAQEIRTITRKRGADVVFDFVGSDATLALAAAVVRPLGHLNLVGIAGGSIPFSFFSVPYEVSLATTYWGSLPELMEVLDLARTGRIKPVIETYPLDRALDAYDAMRNGRLTGRAVITP
jgi:propanol-preferring alcohol dehydrogenase